MPLLACQQFRRCSRLSFSTYNHRVSAQPFLPKYVFKIKSPRIQPSATTDGRTDVFLILQACFGAADLCMCGTSLMRHLKCSTSLTRLSTPLLCVPPRGRSQPLVVYFTSDQRREWG